MKRFLLRQPSADELIGLLMAWRVWVAGGIAGAVIAAIIYLIAPPTFRAQATVIVDLNVEQVVNYETPDRNLNYFLERESSKLVELAWSDGVLSEVAAQTGYSVADLRSGVLQLSQPSDGGWRFYAYSPDPARAQRTAAAWAQVFHQHAMREAALGLQMYQIQNDILLASGDVAAMQAQYDALRQQSFGIDPFLDVSLAQVTDLPVSRRIPLGAAMAAGSLLGALGLAWGLLFVGKKEA